MVSLQTPVEGIAQSCCVSPGRYLGTGSTVGILFLHETNEGWEYELMQLTRHAAATPQNPGPEVAQDIRFEVKEVIEVHRVMHCPETIFSSGSFGFFLDRSGIW